MAPVIDPDEGLEWRVSIPGGRVNNLKYEYSVIMKAESEFHSYSTLIREQHLDSLGHLHYSRFLDIFEEAWWEMISNNGGGIHLISDTQTAPVIIDAEIKFIQEVKVREKVLIKTRCFDYKMILGKFEHIMFNEKGSEACRAKYTFGLFDLKTRQLIPSNPTWIKALGLAD